MKDGLGVGCYGQIVVCVPLHAHAYLQMPTHVPADAWSKWVTALKPPVAARMESPRSRTDIVVCNNACCCLLAVFLLQGRHPGGRHGTG